MSATATKDKLLNLLNEADDTTSLVLACETIATVLDNTEGMWQESNYCYKASEIAGRCVHELDDAILHQNHWKTLQLLRLTRNKMQTLSDRYYALQQEYMNPAVLHCQAG
jgi:hypothetical protein